MLLQSWSMSIVDVTFSLCLATGLLKLRTARNSGIMKVFLPFLSPFYYACKYRTLSDMCIVGAQTLQLCNLIFCIFLNFLSSNFFECICYLCVWLIFILVFYVCLTVPFYGSLAHLFVSHFILVSCS